MEGMFFTRVLFSCLVDADYSDTAEFMSGQPEPLPPPRPWRSSGGGWNSTSPAGSRPRPR